MKAKGVTSTLELLSAGGTTKEPCGVAHSVSARTLEDPGHADTPARERTMRIRVELLFVDPARPGETTAMVIAAQAEAEPAEQPQRPERPRYAWREATAPTRPALIQSRSFAEFS